MAGHIFIYGGIGTDKRLGEISAEYVRQQIAQYKTEDELVVHIISNGGDVFEGEAIYNALKNTGKKITTHIEGTCASIATLIAAAGEQIVMNKTARFMIHNPKISAFQAADSRDLRHVADQLDQIKTLLINVYDQKTSLGKEKLWELYDNETWLTADEAQQMGFIDESVDAIKAVAKVDLIKIKTEMEQKKAEGLWAKIQNLLSLSKFKNEFSETLQDGRVILVMAETEDWTGAQVVLEDGTNLPAGDYVLASGKTLTIDDSGVISKITEAAPAAPAEEDTQNQDMENKIKELEAQLAEAKAAKQTADAAAAAALTQATSAEAKSAKFENRLAVIEKSFLELKESAGKTFGDRTDPDKGPAFKNANERPEDPMMDAMARDLGQAYVTSRPSNTFLRK